MQDSSKNPTKSGAPADQKRPTALSGTIETNASLDELKRKAVEDICTVKEKAKEQGRDVAEKAEEVALKQKNTVARYASSIGTVLEKVGTEMQSSDDAAVGKYAKELGTTIQSFAKDIEGKKLSDVAGMAEGYGRKQPLAFLGIAALAGLVTSRFLTASAHRRASAASSSGPTQPSPDLTSGGSAND
jgi:ElaB/YqjD/DUF883 family membrane-anchored ribosome-binding protein